MARMQCQHEHVFIRGVIIILVANRFISDNAYVELYSRYLILKRQAYDTQVRVKVLFRNVIVTATKP